MQQKQSHRKDPSFAGNASIPRVLLAPLYPVEISGGGFTPLALLGKLCREIWPQAR